MAMSGGVDSSVSAALLKQTGYEVRGVFLRLQDGTNFSKSLSDAGKIAKILEIPLKVVDARAVFKKEVIGYFLNEYRANNTPNPCVFCNEHIKFKILFEEARKMRAEYIATGHYARLRQGKLYEAKDRNKDQSYFLYRLKQRQLSKIIFPLGEYEKTEVKKLAKKFGLPVYEKKESQDVCFLSGICPEEFLAKKLKLFPGEIADGQGKIIGRHQGLPLYTIGQRRRINIGGTGPYYVVGKNAKKNQLIVASNEKDPALFSKTTILKNVRWVSGPAKKKKVLMRTRYRDPLVYATIDKNKAGYEIIFSEPQKAVATGQSAVFYGEDGEVLGGGIISASI